MHKHRVVPSKTRTFGFRAPVRNPENRAAHGNVCYSQQCACGAIRNVNANGAHREAGPWFDSFGNRG